MPPPRSSTSEIMDWNCEKKLLAHGRRTGIAACAGGWTTENHAVYRTLKAAAISADMLILQHGADSGNFGDLNFSYETRRTSRGQLEVRRLIGQQLGPIVRVIGFSKTNTLLPKYHCDKSSAETSNKQSSVDTAKRSFCAEREYLCRPWQDRVTTMGNLPTSFCFEIVLVGCADSRMAAVLSALSRLFQKTLCIGSSSALAVHTATTLLVPSPNMINSLPLQLAAVMQTGDVLLFVDGSPVAPILGHTRESRSLSFEQVLAKLTETASGETKTLRLLRPTGLLPLLSPSPSEITAALTLPPILSYTMSLCEPIGDVPADVSSKPMPALKVLVASASDLPAVAKRQAEATNINLSMLANQPSAHASHVQTPSVGRVVPWEWCVDSSRHYIQAQPPNLLPRPHGSSLAPHVVYRDRSRWCIALTVPPATAESVVGSKRKHVPERSLPLAGTYLLNKFDSEEQAIAFLNLLERDAMGSAEGLTQRLLSRLIDWKGEQARAAQASHATIRMNAVIANTTSS